MPINVKYGPSPLLASSEVVRELKRLQEACRKRLEEAYRIPAHILLHGDTTNYSGARVMAEQWAKRTRCTALVKRSPNP